MSLRAAEPRDADDVRRWRNDEGTRASSFSTRPIEVEEHLEWFAGVLQDDDRRLLIIESSGEAIGVLRFDRGPSHRWEVSINLAPSARGAGIGTRALVAGVRWLGGDDPGATEVVAQVRGDNHASLAAFRKAGFEVSAEAEGRVTLLYRPSREGAG